MNAFEWFDICENARNEFKKWMYIDPNSTTLDQCCICLTSPTDARIRACEHNIHAICLNEWTTYSKTCPLCRTPLTFCVS